MALMAFDHVFGSFHLPQGLWSWNRTVNALILQIWTVCQTSSDGQLWPNGHSEFDDSFPQFLGLLNSHIGGSMSLGI